MSNSIMRDKAKEFAKSIVFLCRNMKAEHKEMVLVNQLLRSGTSMVPIFTKHNMRKAQGTLYLNLKLLKRNAMKQNIGLSFCMKRVVSKKQYISLFRTIAVQYEGC